MISLSILPDGWVVNCDPSQVCESSPVPERLWDDGDSLSVSRIGPAIDDRYRVRLSDDSCFDIWWPEQVIVDRSLNPTDSTTLDHFLADQIVPRLIAHGGTLVLHAGAVQAMGGCLLIVGQSGRGKSTLSKSFDNAGCRLMGDDAMMVMPLGPSYGAEPVYPSLRLMEDSIRALFSEDVVTSDVGVDSPKQRVDMVKQQIDPPRPIAIRAAFVIAAPSENLKIAVRPLSIAGACMVFIENSFTLDPTDMRRTRGRLDAASALARAVPTFEIAYPRDYARLAEVRGSMLDYIS